MKKRTLLRAVIAVVLVLSMLMMVACGSSSKSNSGKQNKKDTDKVQTSDAAADSENESKAENTSDSKNTSDNKNSSDNENSADNENKSDSDNSSDDEKPWIKIYGSDYPTYDKMNFTLDGVKLAVPATVSTWEAAGLTVSYDKDPNEGACSGRAWSSNYNSFFIELTVAIIGGPFGDEPCIIAAELPAMQYIKRDMYATPEIPEITLMDGEIILGNGYDLSSMEFDFGDSRTIYSYGTYDEESASLMMVWDQNNGWQLKNDMTPFDAWFTEYHYENQGLVIWLDTWDRGFDTLCGFRLAFNRTWK